jgi:hypothetical protein
LIRNPKDQMFIGLSPQKYQRTHCPLCESFSI